MFLLKYTEMERTYRVIKISSYFWLPNRKQNVLNKTWTIEINAIDSPIFWIKTNLKSETVRISVNLSIMMIYCQLSLKNINRYKYLSTVYYLSSMLQVDDTDIWSQVRSFTLLKKLCNLTVLYDYVFILNRQYQMDVKTHR